MSFSSLGLAPSLVQALAKYKYKAPYPIQAKAIPAILSQKDVLGIAQTGSGKTASYVLPILTSFQGITAKKNREVNVLILVPTRELAVQVGDVVHQFGAALPNPVKSMAVYGGVSINPQMKGLYGINILIATPGRLLELVDSKAVGLGNVETLVLDEADKMLNLGFKDEMNRIFTMLPKQRQNLLFSATLSPDLDSMKQVLLSDPTVIKIESEEENLDLIEQTAYFVKPENKGPLLRFLLKTKDIKQVLIFTSSVQSADKLVFKLRGHDIDATAIHSKKSQGSRTDSLTKFKNGKLRVLVATDLLSRGIDIEFLPFVINFELPRSPKDYVHRIGRTGRAENPGEAIAFISPEEEPHFKIVLKKMKLQKPITRIDAEKLDLKGA
jgi:ATP-dependent RNA helicase RhlE